MRNQNPACFGREVQNSEIVNSIERLRLEIGEGEAPKKAANDRAVEVIIRLKLYFHQRD